MRAMLVSFCMLLLTPTLISYLSTTCFPRACFFVAFGGQTCPATAQRAFSSSCPAAERLRICIDCGPGGGCRDVLCTFLPHWIWVLVLNLWMSLDMYLCISYEASTAFSQIARSARGGEVDIQAARSAADSNI